VAGRIILLAAAFICMVIAANPVVRADGLQLACTGKMEIRQGTEDPTSETFNAA
jgi:hypothetical protein